MTKFENAPLNRQERVALAGEQDYYSTILSSRMQAIISEAGVLEARRTLPTITVVSNPIFVPGHTEQYIKAEMLRRRIIFGGEVIDLTLSRYDADDSLSSSRSLSPDEYARAVRPEIVGVNTPEGIMRRSDVYYDKKRFLFMDELEAVEVAVQSLRPKVESEPEDDVFYNRHLFVPVASGGDVALNLSRSVDPRLGDWFEPDLS